VERIVYCEAPVGQPREVGLEEAYAAFLALQGVEAKPEEEVAA
jgi:hypothetical protein